jgi:uncharacterized protein YijF (DUF1287 family)
LLSALLSPTFHLSIKEKKRKEKKTILIIGNCGDGKEEEGIAWTFCPCHHLFLLYFWPRETEKKQDIIVIAIT